MNATTHYRSQGWWSVHPFDLVGEAAVRHPDGVALVTATETLTYADLDEEVDRVAATLARSGVTPSDRVLVVAANDPASLIILHGVLRAGALAMVALLSSGASHVVDIVQDMQPKFAIKPTGWAHPTVLEGPARWYEAGTLRSTAAAMRGGWGERPPSRDPDAPSVVIFTSGTTARPKGVVHSLNTLASAGRNLATSTGLVGGDGLFVVSPVGTVTGILHALVVPPLIGGRAVLVKAWEPASALDLLLSSGASFFGGPDVLLDRILDEARSRHLHELPLKCVLVGGSMLDRRILERAEADFGITVMRSYGSSEAPISTSAWRTEPKEVRLADEGVPLTGVQVRIGSAGDASECCVSGPHLFLGYVDPEATQAALEDGWFRTGDQAEFVEGRLRVFGRLKDIVIRNGLKVPIAEVEGLMARVPEVVQAAGFVRKDSTTGERLAMALRLKPGTSVSLPQVTDRLLELGLAKWKLPEELVVWDGPFPETASGKVQRSALAERADAFERLLAPRLSEG